METPIVLTLETLPRRFMLDEEHRLIMECSARPGEPLDAHYFSPHEIPTRLPYVLDHAIRVLSKDCASRDVATTSATFGFYAIQVQMLEHEGYPRTSVVIDFAEAV